MAAERAVPAWKATSALLTFAMGISIYATPTLGILAAAVIADFGLSRGAFGFLLAGSGLSAACASPLVGGWLDRFGAWRGLLALFVTASVSTLVMALAPNVATLAVAVVIAGIPSALGNPATNKIIARDLEGATRGAIVGFKQAGVQIAIACLGLLLPALAVLWSWRVAVLAVGAMSLLGIPWALWLSRPGQLRPDVGADSAGGHAPPPKIGPGLLSVSAYAAFMGIVTGAVISFLPLYSQEALRFTEIRAGQLATIVGSVGVVARIGWAMVADRREEFLLVLAGIAAVALVASTSVAASTTEHLYLIWIGAALAGASSSAWNPVAMLAAMKLGGQRMAGRATGIVASGFLGGFALAPMLFGWLVDAAGSYRPAWGMVAVCSGTAAMIALLNRSGSRPVEEGHHR